MLLWKRLQDTVCSDVLCQGLGTTRHPALWQHGPTTVGSSWEALRTRREQHPTGGLHALKQALGEENGESSANSRKAAAIYARAILTYFACKQQVILLIC